MTLEAHIGEPVTAKLCNGELFQFERVSPSILVELGSYHRALTGKGAAWLSLDECMELLQTLEGMRWVAWRCAVKYQPEYRGNPGREKFKPLVEDFNLLCDLTAALTTVQGADDSDPPEAEGAEA